MNILRADWHSNKKHRITKNQRSTNDWHQTPLRVDLEIINGTTYAQMKKIEALLNPEHFGDWSWKKRNIAGTKDAITKPTKALTNTNEWHQILLDVEHFRDRLWN